jgi:hypothetical protein
MPTFGRKGRIQAISLLEYSSYKALFNDNIIKKYYILARIECQYKYKVKMKFFFDKNQLLVEGSIIDL